MKWLFNNVLSTLRMCTVMILVLYVGLATAVMQQISLSLWDMFQQLCGLFYTVAPVRELNIDWIPSYSTFFLVILFITI